MKGKVQLYKVAEPGRVILEARSAVCSLTLVTLAALAIVTAIRADEVFHVAVPYGTHMAHLTFPLVTLAIIFAYGIALARLLEKSLWPFLVFSIVVLGIGAQLVVLLAELLRGTVLHHPFHGSRRIYGWYASVYGAIILGTVAYAAGSLTRRSVMESDWLKAVVAPFVWAAAGGSALLLVATGLWQFLGVMVACCFAGIVAGNRPIWAHIRSAGERLTQFVDERPALVVAGVFALALTVRLAFAWRIVSLTGPNFLIASDDGDTYGHFATLLAQGQTIPKAAALYWGGFVYGHFLGIIYSLFGLNNFLAIAFIQAVCGAVVPVCTFFLGRWLFGSAVALGAALLSVASMHLIFLSAVVGMEALFIPLMIAHLVLLVWAVRTEAIRRPTVAAVLGVMLGVVYAVRNEVLLFPVVVIILFIPWGRRRFGLRGVTAVATSYLMGFAAVYLLGSLYNWWFYEVFTFSTRQAPAMFPKDNQALVAMGFNPFDDFRRSFYVLMQEPFHVLSLWARGFVKRGLRFIIEPNFGLFDPFTLVNPSSGFVYRYPMMLDLYGLLLLVIGLWRLAKVKRLEHRLLVAYLLYTFIIYAMVATNHVRHRGVLIPLAYICIIVGFLYLWQACKHCLSRIKTAS